jgi:hypothetical protein
MLEKINGLAFFEDWASFIVKRTCMMNGCRGLPSQYGAKIAVEMYLANLKSLKASNVFYLRFIEIKNGANLVASPGALQWASIGRNPQ